MAKGHLVTVSQATGRDDQRHRRRRGQVVSVSQATGHASSAYPTLDPLAAIRAAQAASGGDDGQGHGLFGHLGEIAHNFEHGASAAIHGFIPSIETIASSAYHDLTTPGHGLLTGNITDSELYRNVVKPQAQGIWHTYGPALHGHLGETLHRAEDDPFSVALDLITVASAGLGRAAAVALTPAELGGAARATAALTGRYGGPAREITVRGSDLGQEVATRTLPRAGYRAGRMLATDKAIKMLPPEFPVLGEFARAARQDLKEAIPAELRHQAHESAVTYLKAFNRLTRHERVAAALVTRLPNESYLNMWRSQLEYTAEQGTGRAQKIAASTLKLINNEKVLAAYRYEGKGGERTQTAVEAGRELATAREEILRHTDPNQAGSFDASPFRHILVVHGAEVLSKGKAQEILRGIDRQLSDIETEQKRTMREARKGAGVPEIKAGVRAGEQATSEADRLKAYQDRIGPIAAEADTLGSEADRLHNEYAAAREGGDISTAQMDRYGVSVPLDYGTGLQTSMGQAFGDAEHQAALDAHTAELQRLQGIHARLTRGGAVKEQPDVTSELQHAHEQLAALRERADAVAPGAHAERELYSSEMRRLVQHINELEQQAAGHHRPIAGEADINEILQTAGVSVKPGSDMKRVLERAAANIQKQIDRHIKATPKPARIRPDMEMKGVRDRVMRGISDELSRIVAPRGNALGSPLEKALVAEWAHAQALLKEIDARERAATSHTAVAALREQRITLLSGMRQKFAKLSEIQHELLDNRAHVEGSVGSLFGGPPLEQIRAEIEASGRPMPYYTPDVDASKRATKGTFARSGTGLTPSRSDVRQSHHTLFRMGMLALDSNVLTPSFMRAIQHDYRRDLHERAMRAATPIGEGEGLPAGHRWVRETRGEAIPYTETMAGEHMAGAARSFPEEYEKLTIKNKDVPDEMIAKDDEGRRLAVPDAYARALEGETRRAGLVNKLMVSKPLQMWRALVLHTNPNWLTNNVVGNALLATLRFGGITGMKAFLGMIAQTKGARAVRQILNLPETRNHLTHEDVLELYPGQRHGTAVETQFGTRHPLGPRLAELERSHVVPGTGGRAVSARDVAAGTFRLLPTVDRATEGAFRRASLETMLRKSPEAKAIYKAMSKESRNWRHAMREASKDPKVNRMVEREVNDALGSYLSLTASERGVLRQVVPFYAWFREITRILAKTPFDAPLRANIALRVSQVQQERMDDLTGDLPSYMRGVYPLGPPRAGQQNALFLQGADPFGTVPQLARALRYGLFGGGPQYNQGLSSAAGMVNPVLGAAIRQRDQGLAPGIWEGVLQQLPGYRAAFGKTDSTLYPNRDRMDMILRYLGYPVRSYSIGAAHEYAKQGG